MPADVIINPTSGEIYWNDGTGSTQSISIRGDSQNKIDIIGYSAGFSPGSSGIGTFAIATFNDNAGTAAFAPGTTGNELGSATLRWKPFLSTTNISDNSSTLGTNTTSLVTGLLQVNGGIAVSGSASIGMTLLLFNSSSPSFYVGLRTSASHASTTVYTFPLAFPGSGTSVLQSDTSGTLSWVAATSSSGTTAANINTAAASSGVLYPLMANSTTTTGIGASYDLNFLFDATNNVLFADGAALAGTALTTTQTSFSLVNDTATTVNIAGAATALNIGNTANTATVINFTPTGTGQKEFNFGTASASASTATFFGSVNSNRMIFNVNSSGNVYIQTNQVNARVRLFQNNTTGNVSIFGTGGGTLFLGEDTTTNNADIAIKGTVINSGGGNVRAALFTLATATSNGSGVGGTILFQTSTSGSAGNVSNTLRTRLRIEGAATGTSLLESVIILGEDASGTAFTSTIRGSDASGTNINAGELVIQAARSTGTGTMAGICFNVASPGASGAALNALIDVGHIYSVQNASTTTLASLVIKGGIGITGNAIIGGTTFISSAVSSTGTGIGALVNSGGFGNAGNAFIGGTTTITNSTLSTGTAAGSLVNAGGFGNAGNAFIGGTVTLTNTTGSGNTTSGSLVLAGGAGIAGSVNIGGILGVGGTLDYSTTGLLGYFSGSSNSYTQVIVHNHSSGNSASSDFIVSNDASVDNATYGDFGINSSGWATTTSPFNSANASYLTATSGDLVLGTTTANALRIGIGGSIFDVVHIPSTGTGFTIVPTTSATGLSTGSLVVRGGFGLVGNAFIGGTATNLNTTSSTGVAAGSFVNAGGFGNAGNAFIGGTTTITSTTSAIGVSGGALVVFGSVGIGRSINIVGGANFWNTANTFYTGLQGGAATSNISYTLPIGPPSGAGTSVLSSTSTGVLSWIAQSSGTASGTADSVKVYDATGATFYIAMAPTNTGAGTSIFANSNFTFNATTSTLISGFTFAVQSGSAISNQNFGSSSSFAFTPGTDGSSSFAVNNSGGGALFVVDSSVGATNVRINRTGSLRLYNSANTFYTSIRGGAATSSIDYTLPIGPPSGAGTSVLSSTSTGVMSWIAQSSGSGSPAGTDTAIQFNDGGSAFGGTAGGLAFAKTTHTVTIGSTNQIANTSKGLLLYNNNASDISNTQRWSPALEFMGRSYTPVGGIDYRVRFLSEVQTSTNTYAQSLVYRFSYDTGTASYTNPIFSLHSQNGVGIGATDVAFYNYFKTSTSQSANKTYILPIDYPAATGTSYLSSSTTGTMAWVAAPTGGSATPGGSNKQIQYNNSTTFGGAGGFEYTTAGSAITVSMFSTAGTGYTAGLWVHAINGSTTRVGIGLSNPAFELEINGEISATNKSFVINHPTKPGMKLRYGSLEGPENGVYVRGILHNSSVIHTPDYWTGLVDPETFTVDLTPIGRYAKLYVLRVEDYKVYVADAENNPIHCYYSVWAERKDIPKLVTEY